MVAKNLFLFSLKILVKVLSSKTFWPAGCICKGLICLIKLVSSFPRFAVERCVIITKTFSRILRNGFPKYKAIEIKPRIMSIAKNIKGWVLGGKPIVVNIEDIFSIMV